MPLTRLQIVKLLPSAEALYAKYINLPQLFSFHSKQQCHASHSGSLHSINATQNHISYYIKQYHTMHCIECRTIWPFDRAIRRCVCHLLNTDDATFHIALIFWFLEIIQYYIWEIVFLGNFSRSNMYKSVALCSVMDWQAAVTRC